MIRAGRAVRAVDANAFGACSATPYVISGGHPGGGAVYVSLIVLSGDRATPDALRASMRVDVDGDRIDVRAARTCRGNRFNSPG